ncbi:ribosomal protein S5 domain 2-type protein [Bombardia bombarda]|uniref:Ribosomal protein S5 domain 2-type protein n=1 Tax=Bombardia bombarda TaxID=252184 RepID=A0AA39WIG3_9PEZI|nr:ribosomal protein S5 domain 2-type protein [Bombardia bombarda]
MSEELADELEAINAIYNPGTLVQSAEDASADIYILTLPEEDTASLRLQFSAAYPSEPPFVLGTYSSSEHGKRGAAARDLALFRAAVGDVYEPGQVCLFDAIEKFKELLLESSSDDREGGDATSSPINSPDLQQQPPPAPTPSPSQPQQQPEPPWILSDPVIELKSTFLARCAPVSSPTQAAGYVQHLLSTDRKVRSATHNMTAWRIRGPNGTSFQDCDDDGETAAGGRLLHLMQLMDLWDTMVVVTRWYGGQKLGPRRFALINTAARDAFVKAGLVAVKDGNSAAETTKKKGGHGK